MTDYLHYTVTPELNADDLQGLAQVLHACVAHNASVGFVQPFSLEAAAAFWQGQAASVAAGERILLLARAQGRVVGTVQLIPAGMPNGRHRAEVAKLLVHPDARRQGIARSLMEQVEQEARSRGKRLLVLDTRSGDVAEQLYLSLGYQISGQIPDYVLSPSSHGSAPVWEPTTVMFKAIAA
ncbi:GNAT family N-acetyltransferase [Nissabacter archeti]|uniref:GNAT family N-acetyltransferase n=1 Tax=Nissabacter archeti TaxID=1917880 RepID=UPI0009330422|nr:GNAT family N-acetyltransferase [Nissabacter archeti]